MWIRTEHGNLVNLAQFAEVRVRSDRKFDEKRTEIYEIAALEPFYTDGPCNSATLATYKTKEEATEALNDLFDWLRPEGVGCDFAAALADK